MTASANCGRNPPNARGAREPRHRSSSGRLGPKGRTRMALLASPDVGVRGPAFLKNHWVRPCGLCSVGLPVAP
jgi:hypothetical protein